ncbi:unnamed protein product, partial [Didymodactylos carnosus]
YDNILHCSNASASIYRLLQNHSLNGKEEASYLIMCVNRIMLIRGENQEYYSYLILLMKTLIDKSYYLLQMNVQILNVPQQKLTPAFIEDFKLYCQTTEWCIFIEKQCQPSSEDYKSKNIKPFKKNMQKWWDDTYKMMKTGIDKRTKQIEEEKLRFQSQILELWRVRRRSEYIRYSKMLNLQRLQQNLVDTEWNEKLKYFERERGPWHKPSLTKIHWMLSARENCHRMRCKLIENSHFDSYEEASLERDENFKYSSVDEYQKKLFENLKNKKFSIQKQLSSVENDELLNDEQMSSDQQLQNNLLLEEKEKMLIGSNCSLITITSVTE